MSTTMLALTSGSTRYRSLVLAITFFLTVFLLAGTGLAQTAGKQAAKEPPKEEKPEPIKELPPGPVDEYDRAVPRTSIKGYFKAARNGDFERAAEYLDLRNLPRGLHKSQGPQLARQLKVALDRSLWVDLELVSDKPEGYTDDGLPPYRDSLGRIKTPEKTVNILLQRVPREDGVQIWKISNSTVAEIPLLYEHFGYDPFEEHLAHIFPDVQFLGWQLWQWAMFVIFVALAYVAALLPTWIAGILLRRRETQMSRQVAEFVTGPCRIVVWFLLIYTGVHLIGPSTTVRSIMRAGTIMTIALTWAALRLVNLLIDWWNERLRRKEHEEAIVLLRPARNAIKIAIVLFAALMWLDNIGFRVSTLLAGLGVGGIAIALAAQDTIKNFIGSIMILLDKPYNVGQRIVVKGHDGVVEEIGLRSTKMRLLTGHQTTIPNEEMARVDIENIGRRPHIRRLTNITIPYDTPLAKVEKAVKIIEDTLENHEGMDPEFPPRVYFNEFNPDSLNIIMLYWYHPPDYWAFLAFNQRVNTQIMQEFEKEGINFAFPTTRTYLTQDDGQSLYFNLECGAQVQAGGEVLEH
jgi:MscS family membrane protein